MSRLVMIVNDVGLGVVAGLPRVLREIRARRAVNPDETPLLPGGSGGSDASE
jgi:hypothetical protein